MNIVFNNCLDVKLEGLLNKVKTPVYDDPSYNHLVKADALRIKNHFWDSIEEYLTALEHDNSNKEAHKGLGLAYKQIGCIKSAVSAFNNAKKLNPFDKSLYFEAGCCYCIDHKFTNAIKEFKKALKICPDYTEARYNLALAYDLSRQYDLAIKEYNHLISENPGFIQSYNNLGSLYMKLDSYAKAIKVFKDFLKANPESARPYLGIGISFDKLGDKVKAVRYYKKYLKLKPKSDNIPYIMERMSELNKTKPASNKKSHKKPHLMLVS